MQIVLVGSGKMAMEVGVLCRAREILCIHGMEFVKEHAQSRRIHPLIAMHFGSGRELEELVQFCETLKVPLIQGSTKVEVPIGRDVIIINAPNLSLPMMRFLSAFPDFANSISPGMTPSIVESHQSTKADTSGTARAIVKVLGTTNSAITSIRDTGTQLALGVPEEHLDGHAYHDFIFTGQGVEIKVSTKIRGRQTYAEGAVALAQALADQPKALQNGLYELKDVLPLLPH